MPSIAESVVLGVVVAGAVGLSGYLVGQKFEDGLDAIGESFSKLGGGIAKVATETKKTGQGVVTGFSIDNSGKQPTYNLSTEFTKVPDYVVEKTLNQAGQSIYTPKSTPSFVGPQIYQVTPGNNSVGFGAGALKGLDFGLKGLNLPGVEVFKKSFGQIKGVFN